MKIMACSFLLTSLLFFGCTGPVAPSSHAAGSIEQLCDAWINRNGNLHSNITIRVRGYKVDTSTASLGFYLDENDLRNPCGGSAEYRLPVQRLISSSITPDTCPREQPVWELVIDTAK